MNKIDVFAILYGEEIISTIKRTIFLRSLSDIDVKNQNQCCRTFAFIAQIFFWND